MFLLQNIFHYPSARGVIISHCSAMSGKPYGATLDYKDYSALERKLKGHCLPECLASHLFRSPAKGTIHI